MAFGILAAEHRQGTAS